MTHSPAPDDERRALEQERLAAGFDIDAAALGVRAEASPDAAGAPGTPAWDAAAYGWDPADPHAVAWAAYYSELGWDPDRVREHLLAEAAAQAAPAEVGEAAAAVESPIAEGTAREEADAAPTGAGLDLAGWDAPASAPSVAPDGAEAEAPPVAEGATAMWDLGAARAAARAPARPVEDSAPASPAPGVEDSAAEPSVLDAATDGEPSRGSAAPFLAAVDGEATDEFGHAVPEGWPGGDLGLALDADFVAAGSGSFADLALSPDPAPELPPALEPAPDEATLALPVPDPAPELDAREDDFAIELDALDDAEPAPAAVRGAEPEPALAAPAAGAEADAPVDAAGHATPPLELSASAALPDDVPAQEPAPLEERTLALDLSAPYLAEPEPEPDLSAVPMPELGWAAEHAVPAGDGAVDFDAFDAAPDADPAPEDAASEESPLAPAAAHEAGDAMAGDVAEALPAGEPPPPEEAPPAAERTALWSLGRGAPLALELEDDGARAAAGARAHDGDAAPAPRDEAAGGLRDAAPLAFAALDGAPSRAPLLELEDVDGPVPAELPALAEELFAPLPAPDPELGAEVTPAQFLAFAASAAAAEPDAPAAVVEVSEIADDDILEVGDDVIEVAPEPDAAVASALPAPEPEEDTGPLRAQAAPELAAAEPGSLGAGDGAADRDAEPLLAAPPPEPEPLVAAPPAEPEPLLAAPPAEPEPLLAAPPTLQADPGPAPEPLFVAPPAPAAEPLPAAPAAAPPSPAAAAPAAGAVASFDPVPLEALFATGDAEPETAPAPPPPPAAPSAFVAGTHRVVVHTADGQVKRGTVTDVALDAGEVALAAQPSGAIESLPAERVRAIFFMLPAGEPPPPPEGKKVRVTFRDGRQVAGFSPDYDPARVGFFMIPVDTRTHTARIWVYRASVRQVTVS